MKPPIDQDFDSKVKQVCDLCGLVRYWGLVDGSPCPGVTSAGTRCDGRLRYPIEPGLDGGVESVISDSTDRVVAVSFSEDGIPQLEEKLSTTTVDPPVNGTATLRNTEAILVSSYQDGYGAGREDALRYVIEAGEAHLKNASDLEIPGRDLLREFLSQICGERAR